MECLSTGMVEEGDNDVALCLRNIHVYMYSAKQS